LRAGAVLLALAAGLALAGSPALAAPVDDAAAEVARLEGVVAAAETELQRLTVEAEAASDASLQAQARLAAAQAEAETTAAELAAATQDVVATRDDVADLGRRSYLGGSSFGAAAAFLDAEGPEEVLRRAVTLDLLSDERARRLAEFEVVEDRQARADEAAREAVRRQDNVARAAATAEQEAAARLAGAQQAYDAAAAEKAARERELRDAQIALLATQGAPDPGGAVDRQQATEAEQAAAGMAAMAAAAAGGGAVPPTSGRLTSCYGSRWGSMHYGIDIAAPIGTPIYAPEGGHVLHAGAANGFGQAVYIEHADGTITLYGHVNQFFVTSGQIVSTGQQIAEVGNKGQSTGPHLHFEVHNGGLYADRTNPMPWLAAHGISLAGGC